MLFKKVVYNDASLELNTLYDFQLKTSVPLPFFNFIVSSVF